MKLKNVKIEKFRSIKTASFSLNDITAVVGENNAGKTSILRAINAVLNYPFEEESFIQRHHQYTRQSNSYITLTFSDLPVGVFQPEYIQNDLLTLKFSYMYSQNRRKLVVVNRGTSIPVDDSFLDLLSKYFRYVYIPAGRTNKDVKWDHNSIFHNLVLKYVAEYTEKKDRISGQVRTSASKIHDTVLKKLELQLSKLYMQNKLENFHIDFPQELDYTSLINEMTISLNEYGKSYPLQECGSGVKSLAVIAMYRAYSAMKEGSILLGLEEPETNLHPQAQKRFITSLKNTVKSDSIQAIFTTHSTVVVDELHHDDILLIRRVADDKRGFHSTATKLPSDFWSRYSVEEFKHYQFFTYRNSDFFFAKFVVIGESKNDCQIFQYLVEPEIGQKIADVSFLDAGGADGIKYPYFLLKELQIPFVIIVDHDFFFPYLNNNELKLSRASGTGLPLYRNTLKNNEVINDIFRTTALRTKVTDANKKGYRAFYRCIAPYRILSMQYCLEMDLTCSSAARTEYYARLNIMPEKQTQKTLLVDNYKAIKSAERVIGITEAIPRRCLPESFSKIKNSIVKLIMDAI